MCSPELRLLDMVSTTSWLAELTAHGVDAHERIRSEPAASCEPATSRPLVPHLEPCRRTRCRLAVRWRGAATDGRRAPSGPRSMKTRTLRRSELAACCGAPIALSIC